MKKITQIKQAAWIMLVCLLGNSASSSAQCVDVLGSSPNVFSTYNANTNQIIVNNDLDAVIFIHRNDPSVFSGTDNGVYRYDISADNGATWQVNQGFLNPGSTLGVNGGRYPQVGIYNPDGNKVLSNASLVYHGPTTDGFDWNGYVTGSLLLDGAATSTENYNQAGVNNTLIPGGFCQGAPGVFWAVDQISDDNFSATGIRILKGEYSGGDVIWSVNEELTPDFNIDAYGTPVVQSVNMAFDPTGVNGWVVMMSHLNGLADYNYHLVFYNTTDGGVTWNGPTQLDLTSFGSITSLFTNPAAGFEVDIEVDINGNPHALAYVTESAGFPYGIFTTSGQLYDFNFNGASWNATSITSVSYATRPQVSRSMDGTKMVFTWVESDLPTSTGYAPNLKAVTFDVPTGNISCPISYAQKCPSFLDGQMYQTTVSPNMIEEGGFYTVPVVLTITNASGDQNAPVQHYYLKDLSFTDADFINVATPSTLTISASGPAKFCVGGSVDLTASAASSYLWNTGETTQTITATGGTYWVIDPAESTCISDNNSIAVTQVETPFLYPSYPVICPGGSVDIFVFSWNTPSYDSYLWTPNGETTASITVTSGGTYDVLVDGCPSYGPVVITEPGVPANDNICGAQTLTVGTTTSFNNFCSSAEPNEPVPPIGTDPTYGSCYSQDGWCDWTGVEPAVTNSVWFSFIAPATGAVQIQATNIDYWADYQLALYSSSNQNCNGQLTLVAANDNDLYDWASATLTAYCITQGKRYFVQVDGGFGSTGEGIITVTAIPNTVTICHRTSSTQSVTLTVSGCGLAAHLAHGDVIGACATPRISSSDETDVTSNSLTVYPNPASGTMIAAFESDKAESYRIRIMDIAGRVILEEGKEAVAGQNQAALDVSALDPGVYVLVLNKGGNVFQTRIIKE